MSDASWWATPQDPHYWQLLGSLAGAGDGSFPMVFGSTGVLVVVTCIDVVLDVGAPGSAFSLSDSSGTDFHGGFASATPPNIFPWRGAQAFELGDSVRLNATLGSTWHVRTSGFIVPDRDIF